MVRKQFTSSAPGTIMLFGEHSVLENKHAIVAAIDKRIYTTLTPRLDQRVIIDSDIGKFECTLSDLDNLSSEKSFQFVLTAIASLKEKLTFGFDLTITSNFSSKVGFGSSAAVTVSTLSVLHQFLQVDIEKLHIFQMAKKAICTVQSVGSGADAAASVYGGIILYRQTPPFILQQLFTPLPLTVLYSGYKTPTQEVIKLVKEKRQKHPEIFSTFDKVMDQSTFEAISCIEQQNWQRLGEIMSVQQNILRSFGVSTSLLDQLVDILNASDGIYGAKISGSGLGDCLIGLGRASIRARASSYQIDLCISCDGCRCD